MSSPYGATVLALGMPLLALGVLHSGKRTQDRCVSHKNQISEYLSLFLCLSLYLCVSVCVYRYRCRYVDM